MFHRHVLSNFLTIKNFFKEKQIFIPLKMEKTINAHQVVWQEILNNMTEDFINNLVQWKVKFISV